MQAANSVDLHRLEVCGCKRATIDTLRFRARKRVKLLCHRISPNQDDYRDLTSLIDNGMLPVLF
jgi:hypothetical protein